MPTSVTALVTSGKPPPTAAPAEGQAGAGTLHEAGDRAAAVVLFRQVAEADGELDEEDLRILQLAAAEIKTVGPPQ